MEIKPELTLSLEFVPLGHATLALAPPIVIVNGAVGTRYIVEVKSFRLEGDRIKANLKGSAAADWATAGPTGVGTLDVRTTLETDDGAVIYTHYQGRLDATKPYGDAPIYVAPLFETGDSRYAWLNNVQAVAKGILSPDLGKLEYEIFEVR